MPGAGWPYMVLFQWTHALFEQYWMRSYGSPYAANHVLGSIFSPAAFRALGEHILTDGSITDLPLSPPVWLAPRRPANRL